jgi:hypothetical protein
MFQNLIVPPPAPADPPAPPVHAASASEAAMATPPPSRARRVTAGPKLGPVVIVNSLVSNNGCVDVADSQSGGSGQVPDYAKNEWWVHRSTGRSWLGEPEVMTRGSDE